jgi:hypothetical protein
VNGQSLKAFLHNNDNMKQTFAQSGLSATELRPGSREPIISGPMGKRAKLVVIHGSADVACMGTRLFGEMCDVPKGLRAVTSLQEAKGMVDEHAPDIVLCGKRIDVDPDAHYRLLEHAKGKNPDTVVILWSGGLLGTENNAGAKYKYDAMVDTTDAFTINSVVAAFSNAAGLAPAQEAKRAKVLIIGGDPAARVTCRAILRKAYDVPEIPDAMDLEIAERLLDQHKPDVIMCGRNVDPGDADAHYSVLAYAKWQKPGTRVILVSDRMGGGTYVEDAKRPFDAIVHVADCYAVCRTMVGNFDGNSPSG